jgi:hypothetical protein
MRIAMLILCLTVLCGCADQNSDVRSQAQSQANFMQGLSDGWLGKNSPPTYSPGGSFYAPSAP